MSFDSTMTPDTKSLLNADRGMDSALLLIRLLRKISSSDFLEHDRESANLVERIQPLRQRVHILLDLLRRPPERQGAYLEGLAKRETELEQLLLDRQDASALISAANQARASTAEALKNHWEALSNEKNLRALLDD